MRPQKSASGRALRRACLPLALLACGLAGTACSGGGDPTECTNQGYAALGKGDAESAVDHFADALKSLKPGEPGYDRARMGEIEAKIHLKPDAAAKSFLDYAAQQPDEVDAADYQKVGVKLSENKALTDAVSVLDAGLKRFPDNPTLKAAIAKTLAAAQQVGDNGALDALRGLGYVGSGEPTETPKKGGGEN